MIRARQEQDRFATGIARHAADHVTRSTASREVLGEAPIEHFAKQFTEAGLDRWIKGETEDIVLEAEIGNASGSLGIHECLDRIANEQPPNGGQVVEID